MESVSLAQVQELVEQLPADKLPDAYLLLRHLTEQKGGDAPQRHFMRLPLSERRRLLAEQAQQMKDHYDKTAGERQEWQSGDFQDEY